MKIKFSFSISKNNDKIALQLLNKNPKYANKRNKNSVDEFLLFLDIFVHFWTFFVRKKIQKKWLKKIRQIAVVILFDLNPEHLHRC